MTWDMDTLIKRATILTVAIVAGIAAWISYTHIYSVGGRNPLLPISVDGMIVTSSLVLLAAHRSKLNKTLWLARLTLWLGIVATLLANVYYGRSGGVLGSVVSAWPAVCFVFTVETVMQLAKAQRIKRRAQVPLSMRNAEYQANMVLANRMPVADTESHAEARTDQSAPNPTGKPAKPVQTRSEPSSDTAKVPSIRAIREKLGCGQPVATEIQKILKDNPGMTIAKGAQIRERVKIDARRKQRS